MTSRWAQISGFVSLATVAAALLTACGGAGQYGYSREYSPLDAESRAVKDARELDPVMMTRATAEWKHAKVFVFGVVTSRKDGAGGNADLTLGMRSLAPRNLCDEAAESSCRVTVSDKEHAVVHAIVRLTDGDDIGNLSVRAGSLLRVVGTLDDAADPADGAPVLHATYYRHWPRGQYVTTGDSDSMRR